MKYPIISALIVLLVLMLGMVSLQAMAGPCFLDDDMIICPGDDTPITILFD
jgi:hypothetical protein